MSERIAVVFGTRPEIIKLAPIVHGLGERALTVHTGQHFDESMSDRFLHQFGLGAPDRHLDVGGQTRGAQIGRATVALEQFLLERRPAAVVVQGDTNSGLAGALAANAAGTPLVHLEAGLRSFDRRMPEEHNRVLIDALSDRCLAPHASNAALLRAEGVGEERICVTGSTLREALTWIMPTEHERSALLDEIGVERAGYVLATIHRVENADSPERLDRILRELADLPVPVVFPMHPRTASRVASFGMSELLEPLILTDPLGYREFVGLARESALLVSDSGGVQEEATIVKRPVVVVRNSTERPEILGTFAHLVDVGTGIGRIARELLADVSATHARLESVDYPYGEDAAARCIAAIDDLVAGG